MGPGLWGTVWVHIQVPGLLFITTALLVKSAFAWLINNKITLLINCLGSEREEKTPLQKWSVVTVNRLLRRQIQFGQELGYRSGART